MRQLFLLMFLGCAACSAQGPAGAPAPARAERAATTTQGGSAATLLVQMRTMVGSAPCSEPAQCKTMAIGARACGGPEGYLAYSTAATATAPLQALAQRHAELRRIETAKSGLLSTCNIITDPGATCRAGTCQLRSAADDPA